MTDGTHDRNITKYINESRQEHTELGRHFARCGKEHLSIQIIDCVQEGEEDALRYLEGIWQNRLATFEQHSGNINVINEMKRRPGRLPTFVNDILG